MDRAIRHRFAIPALLVVLLVVGGLTSLPVLQRCCPDPPLPWPLEQPNRSVLDKLFFMDLVPRLAALAAAAGTASLGALLAIFAVTAKAAQREEQDRPVRFLSFVRAVAATFVVGVLYLYCLFLTGYFQLGWFNLFWIIGIPVLLAALTGRDQFERRWGGPFLILPGFVAVMALMIAIGIDPY